MFPCVVFLGFFLSLPFLLVYFPFLFGLFFNCQCILVIMAHSSDYVRIHPDRSRSRDDPPMWRHSNDSRSWNNHYRNTRRPVPPARDTRRVLIIVNLDQVCPVLTELGHDQMAMSTCSELPGLNRMEEMALFTYHVLIDPIRIRSLTVETMLYYISQHIHYTWDCFVEHTNLDLRWQDITGDTFALPNECLLYDLLNEHRPRWTEGQELGILFSNDLRPFVHQNQPYIMRLSCHKALPNRNMLP